MHSTHWSNSSLFSIFFFFFQIIGFVLILCPAYSKVTDLFTSWPIVGGTIACGVFIMLVAAVGIYGTVKHHQIILFFVSFSSFLMDYHGLSLFRMFLKMNHSEFVLLLCSTQGQKLKLSLTDKMWELFTKKSLKIAF